MSSDLRALQLQAHLHSGSVMATAAANAACASMAGSAIGSILGSTVTAGAASRVGSFGTGPVPRILVTRCRTSNQNGAPSETASVLTSRPTAFRNQPVTVVGGQIHP